MVLLGGLKRCVVLTLMTGCLLSGCSTRIKLAPVEDRAPGRGIPAPVEVDTKSKSQKQDLGVEKVPKSDYYTVKPGDTMIRIGLDTGQNWRDIARWNKIDNPNQIEVGQALRVQPPVSGTAATALSSPVALAKPVTGPSLSSSNVATQPGTVNTTAAPNLGEDEIAWSWPTRNPSVLAGFDEIKNKGLDLAGSAGEAVLAAADGRVVYAGSGLRGYGNLVILKHNNTYLTAYAHNQALLIKEDQAVQKGQKIAEMGNSDSDRVKLHFELRRQGKPVDPIKYLPAR